MAAPLGRVFAVVRRPEFLAFLPALTLGGFWFGGESALMLIALGLPFLSGGANLWSVLYTPRIGYVIGFPVAAFVTGWLTRRLTALPLSFAAGVAAVGGGMIVLYAIGIPVAAYMNDLTLAETATGAVAFFPGDLIKAVATGLVTGQLARMRPGIVQSRA